MGMITLQLVSFHQLFCMIMWVCVAFIGCLFSGGLLKDRGLVVAGYESYW